jgi:hypothetical protein
MRSQSSKCHPFSECLQSRALKQAVSSNYASPPQRTNAQVTPIALTVDSSGNVFIASFTTVRAINTAGIVSTIAGSGLSGYSGDGGPASDATLSIPNGLFAGGGNVYVGDTNNGAVRELTPAGGPPVLTVHSEHTANFTPGLPGIYTIGVSNAASAGPTIGTVTVTELPISSLVPLSMSGAGWTCTPVSCTSNASIAGGHFANPITAIMSLISATPPENTNCVTVSGGGGAETAAEDFTLTVPPLIGGILTPVGMLYAGQPGTYTLSVTNFPSAGPITSPVVVTPNPPAGLTVISMSGSTWNCAPNGAYCILAGPLSPNQSTPPLTITVSVAEDVPSRLVNQVILSAGGILPGRSPVISGSTTIVTPCDLSAQGNTTVADVQTVMNQALGETAPTYDLNQDGLVNVLDVQIEINSALGHVCFAM